MKKKLYLTLSDFISQLQEWENQDMPVFIGDGYKNVQKWNGSSTIISATNKRNHTGVDCILIGVDGDAK